MRHHGSDDPIQIVPITRDTTVLQVKQTLECTTGLPANEQQLSLEGMPGMGKVLRNGCKLTDYNIQNHANLIVRIRKIGNGWNIKVCTGEIISVPVSNRADTISTIKPKIERLLSIPSAQQKFVSNGDTLSYNASLADHSSVELHFTIKVHIPILNRFIDVDPKCTTLSVKESIHRATGIGVQDQSLFLEEKILEDPQKPLFSYGVKYGSTLTSQLYGEEIQRKVAVDIENEFCSYSKRISAVRNLLLDYQGTIQSTTCLSSLDAASIVALKESEENVSRCCRDQLDALRAQITSAQRKLLGDHKETMKRSKKYEYQQKETLDGFAEEIKKNKQEINRLQQRNVELEKQMRATQCIYKQIRNPLERGLKSSSSQRFFFLHFLYAT